MIPNDAPCLSAMSNVLEFRATVHAAWKIIKAKTQRNLVAEMHLCMVLKYTKNEARALITSMRAMRVVASITKPMSSEECYN
jgi:hypothetical protein